MTTNGSKAIPDEAYNKLKHPKHNARTTEWLYSAQTLAACKCNDLVTYANAYSLLICSFELSGTVICLKVKVGNQSLG